MPKLKLPCTLKCEIFMWKLCDVVEEYCCEVCADVCDGCCAISF
jgi:hypothetical protein